MPFGPGPVLLHLLRPFWLFLLPNLAHGEGLWSEWPSQPENSMPWDLQTKPSSKKSRPLRAKSGSSFASPSAKETLREEEMDWPDGESWGIYISKHCVWRLRQLVPDFALTANDPCGMLSFPHIPKITTWVMFSGSSTRCGGGSLYKRGTPEITSCSLFIIISLLNCKKLGSCVKYIPVSWNSSDFPPLSGCKSRAAAL